MFEIFVVFLRVVRIVLDRLSPANRVKVNAGVSCLGGPEEIFEGFLEAESGQ